MPSLSGSWFQSGSTDAMIVKDAYQISKSEPVNTQFGSLKGIYNSTIGGLYANKGSVRELASIVAQAKAGTISKTDLLDRALGAMGSSLPGLLGSLGGALAGKIAEAAGTLIGPDAAKQVAVLYGDLPEQLMTAASVRNYQDLASFLVGITGNSELMKLVDVEAESSIIGALAGQLMQFGIPSMVDDAIAQARSEQVMKNAYAFISTDAVAGSDLVMVNNIIDKIGLSAFIENNPDAVNDILSSYYLATADTVDTYPTKRAYLIQTLTRINANWSKFLRNNVYIDNLEPFTIASTDAKTLFMLAEPERRLMMVAPPYTARSVNSVAKDLYPDAYIS